MFNTYCFFYIIKFIIKLIKKSINWFFIDRRICCETFNSILSWKQFTTIYILLVFGNSISIHLKSMYLCLCARGNRGVQYILVDRLRRTYDSHSYSLQMPKCLESDKFPYVSESLSTFMKNIYTLPRTIPVYRCKIGTSSYPRENSNLILLHCSNGKS